MTKAEAVRLVALLQGAFPRHAFPDSTVEAYGLLLGDLGFEAAKHALVALLRTSRFLPSVAEIRERVVEDRCHLPAPELAWGEVRDAVSRVGSYLRPVFECEEIQRSVEVIGWREICLSENLASTRARFVDAYRAIRAERVELEASGRYVPSARQLPAEPEGALEHGAEVPARPRASLALVKREAP